MISVDLIYIVSIWLLPVLIAITFHEAAHGYVARFLGDDTASRQGRVSLNPVRHIDPFGTIILPGLLLLARSPFLFGYAKPVPVNFLALHPPRIGMVLVAAAEPAMNIGLAFVAALSFHLIVYLPAVVAQWAALNLKNALIINVVLAVFNLFPLPPLYGGRIILALLSGVLAKKFARLEPLWLGGSYWIIDCPTFARLAARKRLWIRFAAYLDRGEHRNPNHSPTYRQCLGLLIPGCCMN